MHRVSLQSVSMLYLVAKQKLKLDCLDQIVCLPRKRI